MEEKGDVDTPTVLTPEADKLKRTAVHQCVRKHFPQLESDSISVGEKNLPALRIFVTAGRCLPCRFYIVCRQSPLDPVDPAF